jgi:hypothetical protein
MTPGDETISAKRRNHPEADAALPFRCGQRDLRMSSMVDVAIALGFFGAGFIIVAHAVEAFRAR